MSSKTMGVLLAMVIVVSGCGDGDSTADAPPPSTSSTTAATTTTAPAIRILEDVPYFDEAPGLSTPVLDVLAPTEDGPWPIVVTFHPDAARHYKSYMAGLADAFAARGAVVINPTYGGPGTEGGGRSAELFRTAIDESTCAVWFAIEHAAEYGGDVSDIRLAGFSGGANMAAAVAMHPSDDDRHCSAPATDFDVTGVVVFEGDFALGAGWSNVIRNDPTFYDEVTVWSHLAECPVGPIHVLVDSKTTVAISHVEEVLDLRHPDGPVREAWEALGVIEEDHATLVQSNTLFHDALVEAGCATTLTTIEAGNHSLTPTAEAAMVDLLFGGAGE